MFINIDDEHTIRFEDILCILEYDLIKTSSIMQEMIEKNRQNNTVVGSIKDAKSVIITDDIIYLSSLTVPTFKKRSNIDAMLSNTKEYSDQIKDMS